MAQTARLSDHQLLVALERVCGRLPPHRRQDVEVAGAEVAVEPRLRTDREVAQRPGLAHLGACVALRQPAARRQP